MPRDLPETQVRKKGVSVWGLERRKGMAGKPEVKQMGGAEEMEAPILARRSLPRKGMGLVGSTRKEWVWRRGGSPELDQNPGVQKEGD